MSGGIGFPRQKSPAQRIGFCPQCSVSLAMDPAPEGALNLAAWLPATGTNGAAHPTRGGHYLEF